MKKLLFIFLMLISFNAQARQSLSLSVDKSQISLGEAFVLTLSAQGQGSRQKPDFIPLEKDFDILSITNSYNVESINGVTKQTLEYIVTMMPKQVGKFEIPSIKVGNLSSNSITIDVLADGAVKTIDRPKISLKGYLEKDTAYVQEEINYTLVLIDPAGIEISRPNFADTKDFIIKELGEPKVNIEVIKGKKQRKITFEYALFPQSSGNLTIPSFEIQGYAVEKINIKDPFNNTIFANMGFSFATQRKPFALRTKAETINITPIPQDWGGKWWLPATDVSLTDTFKTQSFEQDKPIKREVKFIAKGVIDSQMPRLDFPAQEGLRQYPENPVSQSMVKDKEVLAISTQYHTYIPTKTGEVVLPEIKVDWFDTNRNQARTTVLPAKTIVVSAPTQSVGDDTLGVPQKDAALPPVIASEAKQSKPLPPVIASEAKQSNSLPSVIASEAKQSNQNIIAILSAFLGGFLISFLISKKSKNNPKKNVINSATNKELEKNLILWAQHKFGNVYNLKDIIKHINNKDFSNQINNLYAHLYGSNANFDKKEFVTSFKKIADNKVIKKEDDLLPKLYDK